MPVPRPPARHRVTAYKGDPSPFLAITISISLSSFPLSFTSLCPAFECRCRRRSSAEGSRRLPRPPVAEPRLAAAACRLCPGRVEHSERRKKRSRAEPLPSWPHLPFLPPITDSQAPHLPLSLKQQTSRGPRIIPSIYH
uniref:Uncharacterized protein n=1 Tax=Oryza barthii TaxID=65489 RepID=A0A0D3H5K3_9ORYZ